MNVDEAMQQIESGDWGSDAVITLYKEVGRLKSELTHKFFNQYECAEASKSCKHIFGFHDCGISGEGGTLIETEEELKSFLESYFEYFDILFPYCPLCGEELIIVEQENKDAKSN